MDAGQLDKVVDSLAEKIGIAAEKLAPIAEETLRQISMRGRVTCLTLGFLGILLVAAATLITTRLIKDDAEEIAILLGVGWIMLLAVGSVFFISSLGDWVAPLPALLGV